MSDPAIGSQSIERAASRSAKENIERVRARHIEQARRIVQAARRLVTTQGNAFTTQELIKEATIALQTFYRYFASKDELILAVIEDMVAEAALAALDQAEPIKDPLERLHFYTASILGGLATEAEYRSAQFMAIEHWRLQAQYPGEVSRASQAYTSLLQEAIEACVKEKLLETPDAREAAILVTHLVRSIFMHQAFLGPGEREAISADQLWAFCLRGLNVRAGNESR